MIPTYTLLHLALALQTDEQEVITFLLTTEIIPLCLRIMEAGSELSKTVSISIIRNWETKNHKIKSTIYYSPCTV